MTTRANATEKSNEEFDKAKQNPGIGTTQNPTNAGMNTPNADEVANQFKKANHIDDNGRIHTEDFKVGPKKTDKD